MQDLTTTRPSTPHPGDFVHQAGGRVIDRFPAGGPRGSWPAEKLAAQKTAEGTPATVVMDLDTDSFLVVKAVA
ncbi:hypothetical protein ACFZAR_36120 [Streptomyces sp. NPDC008222]|uniref:hypothetical protein n=1 Tax=Streptomyces sp. NPDC008222 TaxID=3364820 RepID=UPI0036F139B1